MDNNKTIVSINDDEKIGISRFRISNMGKFKQFDHKGHTVEKNLYCIEESTNGSSWSGISSLTRNEILTLGVLIQRFAYETK